TLLTSSTTSDFSDNVETLVFGKRRPSGRFFCGRCLRWPRRSDIFVTMRAGRPACAALMLPHLRGWVCRMPALQAGWSSRRDGFLRAAPAFTGLRPRTPMQGEVSPCEPLWPASQLFPRLPKPIEHTRPRGIHAPGHSFGVIQTMLLALANFGLERMGRKKPQQFAKLMRPAAGYFLLVFGFWFLVFGFWFLVFGFWFLVFGLREAHKKRRRRSRCGLIRAYSTPK